MANNYCQSSSMMSIPKKKLKQAAEILLRVSKELEDNPEEGYCGVCCDLDYTRCEIWFHGEESVNTDHLEKIARALVEELKLKPFFCSWAYTCDKPRIDEFGGGAFAIVRGKRTIWCDAMNWVQEEVRKGRR